MAHGSYIDLSIEKQMSPLPMLMKLIRQTVSLPYQQLEIDTTSQGLVAYGNSEYSWRQPSQVATCR